MKKFMAIMMCLALCGLATACNDNSASQPKIGVVDLNKLMRDSVPGKEGIKFIEAQQSKLQKELDAIQDKLEKNPEDQAAMQELQSVYATSQQQMQADGQSVVGTLFDAIQEQLNAYREKNGYAMLIRAEALDSFDPKLDITSSIMEQIDKLKIEFKPAPPQTASAPAIIMEGDLEEKSAEPAKTEPAKDEKPAK